MQQSTPSTDLHAPPARTRVKTALVLAGRTGILLPVFGLIGSRLSFGNWVVELAAYWFPFYVWCSLGCAFACLWGGARKSAIFCLLIAMLCAAQLLPLYFNPSGLSAHQANLRILDANVYEKNWRREAFPEFARKVGADVVLMQEVDDDWHARMLELSGIYPHAMHTSRWPGDKMDLGQYGKAAPAEIVLSDELDLPATVTTHNVNGVNVKIMNLHTRSPFSGTRSQQHRREFELLTAWCQETSGPIIVCGDFNSGPWLPLFRGLLRDTRLRQARKGFGITGTWPSFLAFLRTPLDHVLVSPEVEVVDFGVGPAVGSDHRPLLVELYIGAKGGSDDA